MPSSPNYKRNYAQEYKTAKARGETGGHTSPHSERLRARRLAMKKGLVRPHDHKDLDHKVPLSKGGANTPANERVTSEHFNRSYHRTHSGAIKGKDGHGR